MLQIVELKEGSEFLGASRGVVREGCTIVASLLFAAEYQRGEAMVFFADSWRIPPAINTLRGPPYLLVNFS